MIQTTLDGGDEPHLIVSNQARICTECDAGIDRCEKYGRAPTGDVLCAECSGNAVATENKHTGR